MKAKGNKNNFRDILVEREPAAVSKILCSDAFLKKFLNLQPTNYNLTLII